MKFKYTSKLLALGIITNSLLINNSFAGTLSSDTRYETFKGNSIQIDNVLEKDEVDVDIEGNTLVNINVKRRYRYSADVCNSGSYTKNESTNEVKVDISKDISLWNYVEAGVLKPGMLKPNTEYTVVFEKSIGVERVRFQAHDGTEYFSEGVPVKNNKALLRTYSDVSNIQDISVYCYVKTKSGSNIHVKNAIVVEGNYMHEDIDYFENIKSVGQDDINGHKIEILSQNKNLLPNSEGWLDGQIMDGGNVNTTIIHRLISVFTKEYIELKKGQYTFSYPNNYEVAYHVWDKNFNYVKDSRWLTNNTFTLDEDCYIKVTARLKGSLTQSVEFAESMQTNPIDIGNKLTIQLEEGILSTDYTQKLFNKKEILLNEPLRSLPDGVKDRILNKNGQWLIERNCGEVVLDGSRDEDWIVGTEEYGWSVFDDSIIIYTYFVPVKEYTSFICDKLPYITNLVDINKVGVSNQSWKKEGHVALRLNNEVINELTLNAAKKWLQNNPITIVYQLETPVYEPIKTDLSVQLFEGTTHISNNSTIPANMNVTIDRVLNRAIESLELVKTNPTMENLSRARMWINLIDDCSLKDQLQDEINSITNIDDLQLERKSASSNLDVYVKSQNMLSMSLNTNSITFEGYSGIEDMEMLGAVNISINSSLPYSLNAYMPSEIVNSDKSEILPIDILNIKESSEAAYQTFDNTVDKLILKDNCIKGNGLAHNIDLKLALNLAHKADVYKTVIKFEVEQK